MQQMQQPRRTIFSRSPISSKAVRSPTQLYHNAFERQTLGAPGHRACCGGRRTSAGRRRRCRRRHSRASRAARPRRSAQLRDGMRCWARKAPRRPRCCAVAAARAPRSAALRCRWPPARLLTEHTGVGCAHWPLDCHRAQLSAANGRRPAAMLNAVSLPCTGRSLVWPLVILHCRVNFALAGEQSPDLGSTEPSPLCRVCSVRRRAVRAAP